METSCPEIPSDERAKPVSHCLKRAGGKNSRLEDAFFNDVDPAKFWLREKPVHRKMAAMHAEGFTITEIAAATGYSWNAVSQIVRQPHAREYMINQVKQTVHDDMKAFLEAEVLPSLEVLRDVRDNEKARSSDRIAASNSILDRFLGKPTQPIKNEERPATELSTDELERQVSRIVAGVPAPDKS